MKKSCFVLMALMASSAAVAKDLYSAEEHPVTFAKLSLATPLQFPSANYEVDGLRLNLIHGTSFGMYGLDLGLFGLNNSSGAGVSFDLLSDWTIGDYTGLQLSALGNVVIGNVKGVQLTVGCNYVGDGFSGAQFGLVNVVGTFTGLQTGLFNYTRSESFGVQFGVIDIAATEVHGWSVGVFNYCERFEGLQMGVLNIAGDKGHGLQLGVFNCAKAYEGVQLGLLNVIDRGDFPILPFVNVQF